MVPSSTQGLAVRSFALIDMDNFYVSCHRAFDFSLLGIPVIVLSNNDGNGISRSNEAKALGIAMGVPFHEVRKMIKTHGLIVLSSNYPLYADMSNRAMNILARFSPDQEIYSIDECFLELTGFKKIDLTEYGHQIRNTIFKGLRLPCGVGIGATKTLAKLANHCAKKRPEFNRVCNFNAMTPEALDQLMSEIHVCEVWGVGSRLTPKLLELGSNSNVIKDDLFSTSGQSFPDLEAMGIKTVLDLKRADPNRMRERFSVVMEKTIRELNGVVCLELEELPPPKKQIVTSLSFGHFVTDLPTLEEAVTAHMTRAAEKLRRQNSSAATINVFIQTSKFRPDDPPYSKGMTVPMPAPTDDTRQLVKAGLWALRRIYKPGFKYAKAGVMLGEIVPNEGVQTDMFSQHISLEKRDKVIETMDAINQKMGRGTLKLASEGMKKTWQRKQEFWTPRYTTRWSDIPKVR